MAGWLVEWRKFRDHGRLAGQATDLVFEQRDLAGEGEVRPPTGQQGAAA